jgi:carboxypeptidase D
MTFGGKLGFQERPVEPVFVPCHTRGNDSTIAGAGVFGTTHTECELTYVALALTGHMAPQYAPSAAFHHVEFMLGRVKSLSSRQQAARSLSPRILISRSRMGRSGKGLRHQATPDE